MSNIEKISIALPPEMVAMLRAAVSTGEYASSSEAVRDALRGWSHQRELRQRCLDDLRALWEQSINDPRPAAPAEEVLQRLRAKYQAMVDTTK